MGFNYQSGSVAINTPVSVTTTSAFPAASATQTLVHETIVGANDGTVLYTVPAGKQLIVTSAMIVNNAVGSGGMFYLRVGADNTRAFLMAYLDDKTEESIAGQFLGFADAGETIVITGGGPAKNAGGFSGYLVTV